VSLINGYIRDYLVCVYRYVFSYRTMIHCLFIFFRHFESKEARTLRTAVNAFFDHLILVVKTIDQFGPACPTAVESWREDC